MSRGMKYPVWSQALRAARRLAGRWGASAVVAVLVLGCATAPNAPATGGRPQSVGDTQTSHSPYRLVVSAPNSGAPRTIFLVQTDAGWDLQFEPRDLADPKVERLSYWPASREVAFAFQKNAPERVDSMHRCGRQRQLRRPGDYSPCSTQFKVPDNPVVARMLVGVMSGGMSEAQLALDGDAFFKLDPDTLMAVLSRLQLKERVARHDYQQAYARAKGKEQLSAFASTYASYDPDKLVEQARRQVQAIEENAAILKKAQAAVPDLRTYRNRYTPSDPTRYCSRFRGDAEAFGVCKTMAPTVIAELAQARAAVAERFEVCTKVFQAVGRGSGENLCRRYSLRQGCSGAGEAETKTCNVLLGKG